MVSMDSPQLRLTEPEHEEVLAHLYGEPIVECPEGLFIPPDALRVFLESFEGPLDLLLYLIRKQKLEIETISMTLLTEQYMQYVELIRQTNLELAAAYLVMSATLMQIKSRMLLPVVKAPDGEDEEDPHAELMRRLLEYERIRELAKAIEGLPRVGRDVWEAHIEPYEPETVYPEVDPSELAWVWGEVIAQMSLTEQHKVMRQSLSIREHMSSLLRRLRAQTGAITFKSLCQEHPGDREQMSVWFMAMLELAKDGLVELTQAEPYADIYIEANQNRGLETPDYQELVLTA